MEGYYTKLAAAYIRGYAKRTSQIPIRKELMGMELDDLLVDDLEEILQDGKDGRAKLYAFKDTHTDLPRVRRVLGFLKSIPFNSLLDVGSGRGVFLFPFLQEFPWVDVTSVDILDHRVEFLQDISSGGIINLKAVKADLCSQPFPDKSVDVVTLLEVLEHIPDVGQAVKAAVRMARKHVVVTVPSKPDNNPEHIHLLTKDILTQLFYEAGCTRLRFDGVTGHLFLVATI